MKAGSRYEIDIFKLKDGQHTYDFDVQKSFFEEFENSPVRSGQGNVDVILEKDDRMIQVRLKIQVAVPLECDKTLKPFDYLVSVEKDIVYKYGEQEEELDEDLYMITKNTQRINLAQLIYEFICIAIPMRKIHPDHADEAEGDELIYRSDETGKPEDDDDEPIDPRWSKLKDLS